MRTGIEGPAPRQRRAGELGLTKVRFLDDLVASLGMLPGAFLGVYPGKGIGRRAEVADVGTGADHTAR